MNWIKLNGVDSRDINGLLIQSLPPIVKPKIRTNIVTIDGRDGDIVTKLGYSAYDREISIGLHGEYELDEIVRFFNSEGVAILSNEPFMYYNYMIVNEIDFERLLRFRTAKVKLHCQPFKYAVEEKPKVFTNPKGSVNVRNSGNIIAKPTIRIEGSRTINLSLNGLQLFKIELGNETGITIDTEAMEAYNGGVLMNRRVTGDYDKFALETGQNTVSFDGTVNSITFTKYSRWL